MARVYSSQTWSTSRWSHSASTWRVAQHVEPPGPEPVDRAEQDVEGVAGEQVGHVVHPVLVVVDLEAEHDGQAGGLDRFDHLDVVVEVDPGVVVPVGGHAGTQRLAGQVVPEAAEPVLGLGEPEEVLGHGDLGDARGGGALAVGGDLVDGGLGVALLCGQRWRW